MYEKIRVSGGRTDGQDEGLCHFCNRPRTTVLCRGCNKTFENVRVGMKCPKHPRSTFLMDWTKCCICKSTNLVEIEGSVTSGAPHGVDEMDAQPSGVQPPSRRPFNQLNARDIEAIPEYKPSQELPVNVQNAPGLSVAANLFDLQDDLSLLEELDDDDDFDFADVNPDTNEETEPVWCDNCGHVGIAPKRNPDSRSEEKLKCPACKTEDMSFVN